HLQLFIESPDRGGDPCASNLCRGSKRLRPITAISEYQPDLQQSLRCAIEQSQRALLPRRPVHAEAITVRVQPAASCSSAIRDVAIRKRPVLLRRQLEHPRLRRRGHLSAD